MLNFNEIQKARSAYASAINRGASVEAAGMAAKLAFFKQRGAQVRENFRKAKIAERQNVTPEIRRLALELLEKRRLSESPLILAALAKAKTQAVTDQAGEAADALREAADGLPAEIQNIIRAALGPNDSAARTALGFLDQRFPKVAKLIRSVRASENADALLKSATSAESPLVRAASARALEILKTHGDRP